jgi:hypothetical protein
MTITTMVDLPIEVTHYQSEDGSEWIMKEEYAVPYRASLKAQEESWLAGEPKHNHFKNECCPDFSCCEPSLLWPLEKRQLFVDSNEDARLELMFGSLFDAIALATKGKDTNVHIAGLVSPDETVH